MSRGFKRDAPVTMMLRENGILLDARSFVAYDSQMVPHLLLKGDDIKMQRERVWESAKEKCGVCGGFLASYYEWEMDHKTGGASGRCDCVHNLQAVHHHCHEQKTRKSEHH
jgi:hypothetical protein